jgi:hypothetical protein
MRVSLFVFLLWVAQSSIISGQCSITNLSVQASSCDEAGKFYVTLQFDHTGTSGQFKVQGNGRNYGLFTYDSLPIQIGPLNADCLTPYEFVVRDAENASCVAFKELGKKCCEQACGISIDSLYAGTCTDGTYPLYLDLSRQFAGNGFDLYNNGTYFGYYSYDKLPLQFDRFPTGDEINNVITVCANDKPGCCDTITISNPCVCGIYKIRGQVIDCKEDSSTFSLRLNFKYQLTSDSFIIGGGGVNYGKYAYKDLPITLRDLPFGDSIDYEFLIVDESDFFCFGAYPLGIVTACNFDCEIKDVDVEITECEDGDFYADIYFTEKNTSLEGFVIRGNGRVYDTLEYGETFYKVGPLEGDCETLYEFEVRDLSLDCHAAAALGEPVCCDPLCEMGSLTITEFCFENTLVAFDLNFEHTKTEGSFVLRINDKLIGTFPYTSLPLKITQINFDLPVVLIKIFDTEDESCRLLTEYVFACYEQPSCNIFDFFVKAGECNENGKFNALFKFKVQNPGNAGFKVFVNGQVFGPYVYGKDIYELGPLAGNCETLYKFIIQDIQKPDCKEDFGFTEKICCEKECSNTNPLISFSPCEDGVFDLNLNFTHTGNTKFFVVKVNGIFYDTFSYADLPIKIRGLKERQAYQIIVRDTDKESCSISLTIPAIECTSGSLDETVTQFGVRITDNHLYLEVDESASGHVAIYNLSGSFITGDNIKTIQGLNIQNLPSGIYVVLYGDGNVWQYGKFVKW